MQNIVRMHANPILSLIMINVILTPVVLVDRLPLYGWVDGMQVQMFLLGEFCFEERELPRLSHVSRQGSDLGLSACCLSFEILLYHELYFVEIIYVVEFILY